MALGEGEVTIGSDEGTANAIQTLGGQHVACPVESAHVDQERRIVTAPAYMVDTTIDQVARGIEEAVDAVLEMCG
jgi:enhancing lycopene biosynthesis protein 2